MKNILLILSVFITFKLQAACVHEYTASGFELLTLKEQHKHAVDISGEGRFEPLNEIQHKISPIRFYQVQLVHQTEKSDRYDERYVKYYRYARMLEFLTEQNENFEMNSYKVETVGHSLAGRELKVVYPTQFDQNKKLIVMFGRHHGDEGTANWIIEGFVNEFFSRPEILANYQLVLYPMVNPDGAENRVRYNNNRYDLNRVWGQTAQQSRDEIKYIHAHLQNLVIDAELTPVITLDMHGSFTEDFIYRVGRSTFGQAYYDMQQLFIDELGAHDPWQAANFILSEGEPGMARIRLAKLHGWNTLTHESIRDIPLQNRSGRSLETLKEQGIAALDTIYALY